MTKSIHKDIEAQIQSFREYYEKYFTDLQNKHQSRQEFASMYAKFKTHFDQEGDALVGIDLETIGLVREGRELIQKYLGQEGVKIFDKELKYRKSKDPMFTDNFLANIFMALGEGISRVNEKEQRSFKYKMEMLKYIFHCIHNNGLHPEIYKRDDSKKRYNVMVHYEVGGNEKSAYKVMLTLSNLKKYFITNYHADKKIILSGSVFKSELITQVKITSTKLTQKEIPLYADKHGFKWDHTEKDDEAFLDACEDETDHLIMEEDLLADYVLKNGKSAYVDPKRIKALERIESNFDLSRLVLLCQELNSNLLNNSLISVAAILRTIIHHVPTIFGHSSFQKLVNNHAWEASVKKSLKNLLDSSKNISDHALHTQAKEAEADPTIVLVDFSNDLDVLLAEVVKHLK